MYRLFSYKPLGLSGNPVKIDYSVVTNNNYQGRYTLAHELGHNFGLGHIFTGLMGPPYDNYPCSNARRDRVDYMPFPSIQDTIGDGCSDTPPTPQNSTCAPPQGSDTCSIGSPPWPYYGYENLMGYSFCTNATFSSQQAGRMNCELTMGSNPNYNYAGWLAYGNLHCNPNPNTANNDLRIAKKLKLDVVPNPFSEITNINVSFPLDGNAIVEIYNCLGQQVGILFNGKVYENQIYSIEFDGKQLRNGIYFVVVRTNQETKISKIVVAK